MSPTNFRHPRQQNENETSSNSTITSADVTTTPTPFSESSSSSSSVSSSSSSTSSSSQSSSSSSSTSTSTSASSFSSFITDGISSDSSSSQTASSVTSSFAPRRTSFSSSSESSVTTITSLSDALPTASTSEHFLVTEPPSEFSSIPTSSSTPSTFLLVPTPVTSSTPTPMFTSGQSTVGSSSKGFWSDKKAVAGTFTALALIILGISFTIAIFFIRKRRRNKASDRDTLFDKFPPEPGLVSTPRPVSSSTHSISEDLHRRQPMDPNTAVSNYNYQHQNLNPFSDPAHANGSLSEITYSYAKDVNNQYPSYDEDLVHGGINSSSQHLNPPAQTYYLAPPGGRNLDASSASTSNPFRDPSPGVGASRRSPPAMRSETVTRERDSYQPSLDSFYGVEHNHSVGYAR